MLRNFWCRIDLGIIFIYLNILLAVLFWPCFELKTRISKLSRIGKHCFSALFSGELQVLHFGIWIALMVNGNRESSFTCLSLSLMKHTPLEEQRTFFLLMIYGRCARVSRCPLGSDRYFRQPVDGETSKDSPFLMRWHDITDTNERFLPHTHTSTCADPLLLK